MVESKKPPNSGGKESSVTFGIADPPIVSGGRPPLFVPVTKRLGKDGRKGISEVAVRLAELLENEGAARPKMDIIKALTLLGEIAQPYNGSPTPQGLIPLDEKEV